MPTIREYLVSLGAEIDNKSFGKFNSALKTAGMTAAKFGAGMAALMTMVAKTSISLDKTTQSYEAMAKKQKKSIELVRAEETALKILGKTKKEVDADKSLQEQYKTLKALGKEMKLPSAGEGEKQLRGFLKDFDKLKMVSTYAMNWINHEFLAKIRAPLAQVRKGMQDFTDKLKTNMPRIAGIVGTVFSNMFRLALRGVSAIGKLLEKIDKLPPAIKLIGSALVAGLGISKFGPVLLIIGGITTLLALLDDYQTWLEGGNAALGEFWQAMKDGTGVDFMKKKLQELPAEIAGVNAMITEFMKGFYADGVKAAKEFIAGIADHDFKEDGDLLGKFFGDLVTNALNFINQNLTNGTEFFATIAEAAGRLMEGFGTAIGEAVATFPWAATLQKLLTGADNLLTVIGAVLFGQEGQQGEEQYGGLVESFRNTAMSLVTGLATAVQQIEPSKVSEQVKGIVTHLFGLVSKAFSNENTEGFADVITTAAGAVADLGLTLFESIAGGLANVPYDEVAADIGTAVNTIFSKIQDFFIKNFIETGADGNKKNFAQRFGDATGSLIGIAQGIVDGIGAGLGALSLSDIKDAGVTVINSIFSLLGEVFSPENVDAALEVGTDLLDIGKNLAISLIDGIGKMFSGEGENAIQFGDVAESVGNIIRTVFQHITEYAGKLLEKDEDGKTFGDKLGDSFKNLGTGIIKAIGDSLTGLGVDGIAADAGKMVNTLFQLIGDLFSPENIGKFVDVGTEFAEMGLTTAQGMIKAIGTAFSQIDVKSIGANMGEGIATFFTKISDWLGSLIEKKDGKESIVASFADTVGTIITSLVDLISTGVSTLVNSGSIQKFGTSLGKFITGGLSQLAEDIKGNKFSFEEVGSKIGTAIGGVIKIGGEFLGNLVTEFWNWLNNGGTEQLATIGQQILQGILAGLGNIYDAIMAMIFGKEYLDAKQSGEDFNKQKQETFDTMKEEGVDYQTASMMVAEKRAQTEQRKTQQVTTFADGTPMTYFNVDSQIRSHINAMRSNNGALPYDMQKWFSASDLKSLTDAYKGGDFGTVENIFAKRYGFENYDQVLKGIDEKGWNATIPQIKIDADTSPAEGQFNAMKSKMEKGIDVPVRMTGGGTDNMQQQALGGRFSTATSGEFGEDGTEYIIPITKPARAKALILQMLQEMGAGAYDILSEWGAVGNSGSGVGGPGAGWSSQPAAMYPSAGGSMKSNSDNNVNVPTTINVYGAGDALMAGQAAARASQSNVLRAVKGVVSA